MENVKDFVKRELAGDNSGHGYQHAIRVYENAKKILKCEGGDEKVVLTAALIHDTIDDKLFENRSERVALVESFLCEQGYSKQEVEEIVYIISNISWKNGTNAQLNSLNAMIVRDADRLDAIGAIGIVRTTEYGVSRGRQFYEEENLNREEEKVSFKEITTSTLSHFYEKLLLLKDVMHTQTAKRLAEKRHDFMVDFLNEFYDEV